MINYTTVTIITLVILAFIMFGGQKTIKRTSVNLKIPLHTEVPSPTRYSSLFIENLIKRVSKNVRINIEREAYRNPKFIAYITNYESEGNKIYALMSIPSSQVNSKKYPVLIFNHGYINPNSYSTINSYKGTFDAYATKDFLVIKSDYRANGNSEGDKQDPLNRLSYPIDILNLIQGLESIPEADTDNILIWGHSLGGDVSLKVIEATNKIKGASLWAPVSADYPESLYYFIRKHRPNDLEKIKQAVEKIIDPKDLKKLSPSQNLSKIRTPIIIHHGQKDESVPYEWSVKLVEKMTELKLPVTFESYGNENHNFTNGSRNVLIKRDMEFFKLQLQQLR